MQVSDENRSLLIRGRGNQQDVVSLSADSVLCPHGALQVDEVDGAGDERLIIVGCHV